ncbi:MAG: hypothetical protein IPP68_11545 [Elusimicrobia bacterium]|nr:hypothetical protein [Elusimicrobiota bacterium]
MRLTKKLHGVLGVFFVFSSLAFAETSTEAKKEVPFLGNPGWTPIRFSYGHADFESLYSFPRRRWVYGVDIGSFWVVTEKVIGLQICAPFGSMAYTLGGGQLGLFNGAGTLYGVQLGLANGAGGGKPNVRSVGAQLGFYNAMSGKGSFLQGGLWNLGGGSVSGLQAGLVNVGIQEPERKMVGVQKNPESKLMDFSGIQLGFLFNSVKTLKGAQMGGLNISRDSTKGLQVGIINRSNGPMIGIQIGLVNWCGTLKGLQVGLINHVKNRAILKTTPLINLGF